MHCRVAVVAGVQLAGLVGGVGSLQPPWAAIMSGPAHNGPQAAIPVLPTPTHAYCPFISLSSLQDNAKFMDFCGCNNTLSNILREQYLIKQ